MSLQESSQHHAKWDAQLRKGTLELAVLAALEGQQKYGLELLNLFQQFETLQITEGTLYPLLDRLKREGILTASWIQQGEQRPRKYYSLTEAGTQKLGFLKQRWIRTVADLNSILCES